MLIQFASVGAGIAATLGAATGVLLLLAPRRMFIDRTPLRRLLFETSLAGPFNRRFVIERRIYRRHRLFGAAVIAAGIAAAALVVYLSLNPRALNLYALLGKSGFRAAVLAIATAALLLLAMGLCLVIRPSVLKGIEAAANRWIEPPTAGKGPSLSSVVLRSPRLAGALLLLVSAFCLRLV